MSNAKLKESTILDTINQVEGFNPGDYAVDYTDLKSGETRKRLPVMAQLAWFRLKYPQGKIAVTAKSSSANGTNFFVGEAKVYMNYNDADGNYLASATASRGRLPDLPTVSPREWSQTAAIGIALRNAGFGLQFHAAGDSFDHNAINELEADLPFNMGQETGNGFNPSQGLDEYMRAGMMPQQSEQQPQPPVQLPPQNTPLPQPQQPIPMTQQAQSTPTMQPLQNTTVAYEEPSPPQLDPAEAAYQNACVVLCPLNKHKGKRLGDLINSDPGALTYIANNPGKFEPSTSAAAKIICEYALQVGASVAS